jgi:uncharacterized protein involved in type VI secretion and phage assembly
MPGRVCVTIPTREKNANELQWARVAHPSGGAKWGHYFLPEVGDQVLLCFENGNIEKPYVIGCVAKDEDKFLGKSVHQDNAIKRIMTKNGNELKFEDNNEGDGDKDRITLTTAKSLHLLKLDNENKQIELTDEKGENCVKMKTGDGTMTIKAKSRLRIEVGDKIKLILNGETGTISVECNNLKIAASEKIGVKTNGLLKVEASQIGQDASSMFKVSSGGIVSIEGSPIKVG